MSTLDGILVAISTVVVSDLVVTPLVARHPERADEIMQKGLSWSRIVLVVVGVVALALSWDPPRLLGLFAQQGVYGLVAASAAPILIGIFRPDETRGALVGALAVVGLAIHFGLNLGFGVQNPAVSAGLAIVISVGVGFLASARAQRSAVLPL
jgi:SSS family solute:Na+ symporter/sodium/pantothenate symporter